MSKSCCFQLDWLNPSIEPDWSTWLRQVNEDPHKALCSICRKIINLSNMGRQAVKSHASYSKHIRLCKVLAKTPSISSCFSSKDSTTVEIVAPIGCDFSAIRFFVWSMVPPHSMNFDETKDRLDDFWFTWTTKHKLNDLLMTVKTLLILSHGNATVESGFSINEDLLVENLRHHSIINQRIVYDYIKSEGGLLKVI